MFHTDLFIELANLPQRQIAAAVRIGAAILRSGHGITEQSARGLLKCDDITWADFKTTLRPFFKWHIGRIDFITGADDRPFSFEVLTESDLQKLDEKRIKAAGKAAVPLTPPQQRLYDLGGFTQATARSFYFQMTRTYHPKALEQAIEIAEQKKPGQPQAYIISILKKKALESGGDVVAKKTFPTRIKQFERPVNPESARTELMGWEAMRNQTEDGAPNWGATGRRKVYRLSTGEIRYEPAKLGEHVPSIGDDPGFLVV